MRIHGKKTLVTALLCIQLTSHLSTADVQQQTSPAKLINIDALGVGYDALQGNPLTDERNPGFKERVLRLVYSNSETTADGVWSLPDYVDAQQRFKCEYDKEATTVWTEENYRNLLSVDAKVEGSVFGVHFSASTDYKKISEGMSSHNRTYVFVGAKCESYDANIKTLAMIRPTDEFAAAVDRLPVPATADEGQEVDYSAYLWLISVYGTHYVSSVIMGARSVETSEFTYDAFKRLDAQSIGVSAAAKASFAIVSLKVSTTVERDKQVAKAFIDQRSTYSLSTIGHPLINGDFNAWAEEARKNPYPIGYSARSITELLTTEHFSGVDVELLRKKRKILNDTISQYWWRCQPDCRIPRSGRPPVLMDVSTSLPLNGPAVVTCKPGYYLLSCAVDYFQSSTDVDRYAVPINATACECKDATGGRCVLKCSNAVQGFQVVSSSDNISSSGGSEDVKCPAGTKVVGCSAKSPALVLSYPKEDADGGSACHCHVHRPSQSLAPNVDVVCYASCAADVNDHVIKSASGRVNVTVGCEGQRLLGCGVQWNSAGQHSRTVQRAYQSYQSNLPGNLCGCYDTRGAVTCYAMCGSFGSDSDGWRNLLSASSAAEPSRRLLPAAGGVFSLVAASLLLLLC
jgi:hypothetical protein